mmetsp:Transcript_15421/g.50444  ORF Transcript_15421/g.50444 Transcript_15421/m.50444 type:complete len:386 (+) Transcript_15421:1091-2248(+)
MLVTARKTGAEDDDDLEAAAKGRRGVFFSYQQPAPGLFLKLSVLGLLLCQNTTYTLVRRYSQATLNEKYDPQEVLLMGEVFKLVFSVCVSIFFLDESSSSPSDAADPPSPSRATFAYAARRALTRLVYLTRHSGKMFALAAIYGVMNVLSYVAIRRVDAAVFTVCAQLKILTTAACSVSILRKRLSPTKWRALLQLVLGCVLVTVPQSTKKKKIEGEGGSSDSDTSRAFLLGVFAVLVEVTLSGFASIYFEKVVKAADDNLSVWDRNYQLALHSILLYLVYGVVERNFYVEDDAPPYRPLHDFSAVAWFLAFLGGGGGLLVALTVKVADSVIKTLAVSISIVTSTLASHFLLQGPLDLPMAIGSLVVALAVLNYQYDATPPDPQK